MRNRVNDIDLSTRYEDRSVSSFNLWQSVAIRGNLWKMTDKEMEAVTPKRSSSADGATGMDWLTPEGLQEMIATSVAEAVKQSLARREPVPVDPHTSAGTSSSGKSKVIKEVATRKSSIWLGRVWPAVCGQLCVEGHLYR